MENIAPATRPIEIDPSPVPHLGPARLSWRVKLKETRHAPKPQGNRPSAAESRKQLVNKSRALTAAKLSDPDISQLAIAEELSVSQRHLQRSYREADSSWSKELQAMRMQQAKRLFERDPALHVSEVAGAVGYRRPHQFAKAFYRANGLWPKDFRRQCREERMASY